MTDLFITLINMSVTASWLVLAVVVLRFLLKKAPKWLNTVLWAFVGFRLVCPFSFESIFSLIPSTDTVPHDIIYSQSPTIHSGIPSLNSTVKPIISETFAPDVTNSINPLQVVLFVAVIVWILGILAMLIYTAVSFFRLNAKVREGVVLKDNIWLCDRIETPFILGLFKPRIFLPSGMAESDIDYVIAHENAHLRRRDHWWKPLGFILLTVYWFNPVMWVAYILLCRDIELACDEKVIKEMGAESKKPYSEALINCSVSRRIVSACPLAFGETGVKGRIKSVLSYKKPTLWVIIVAVISCIVVAVCFLTNPQGDLSKSNPELDAAVSQAIFDAHDYRDAWRGECPAESHVVFDVEKNDNIYKVYMFETFAMYGFENGYFTIRSSSSSPTVMTFEKTGDDYILIETLHAQDGSGYGDSIREMFPKRFVNRALLPWPSDSIKSSKQLRAYAEDYLARLGREEEIRNYEDIPYVSFTDIGLSVEVSNKILENDRLYEYNYDLGYYESLEDGIRYIYRTDYDYDRNVVIFTTEVYATGDITEKIEVDGQTGEIVFSENYAVELPEPETDYYGKYTYLEMLDYTVAGEYVSELYDIDAVHYPGNGEGEAAILIGEAHGVDLSKFLSNVKWSRSLPPIEELSSPGSVEFVINDDYRVTVHKRKTGSLFAYAVVKYEDEIRYYHASYDDYEKAVAILHPFDMLTEDHDAVFGVLSYISDFDSAYISLNIYTKTVFFSLSSFSSYFCNGSYIENDEYIIITSDDMIQQYTFRKDGDNLIFVADKSSEVPEYKYTPDGAYAPCIPDGAVFEFNGFETTYIDKTLWDIDNDGIEENCVLGYGPTSGLFTVTFSAYENGNLEYFNIFNSGIDDIQFGWDENGKLVVRGIVLRYGEDPIDVYCNVITKDGNIVLDSNIVLGSGDSLMTYWGEQGVSSRYAPGK